MSTTTVEVTVDLPPGPTPWPTVDPFLFCVHHHDDYPAGDGALGPAAELAGRDLGMDFSGRDGWSMYHGTHVPGFPQHPHRGFETVTIARRGFIDHADSLGSAARFGCGDVQWVTAGGGIVHSEMFPLLDRDGPNPVELFQIWLNLPAVRKLTEPYFTMLWAEDLPRVRTDGATVTVVAGELDGRHPPPPPPDSWAAEPTAEVAIWVIDIDQGGSVTLPPATGERTVRTVYLFDGDGARIGGAPVRGRTASTVAARAPLTIEATDGPAGVLVLQGHPIGEPVARHGPFVMNDRAGIIQAFEDYQRTGFGGWPWDRDDPVHGPAPRRFARHPDGRMEVPSA
jgi:redox-sensitive bicupin YhaK (pirin superfamily)